MSTQKLDKSKPYAQVYGDNLGRHFEQDDKFFTSEGKLWRDPNAKESAADRAAREASEQQAIELAAQAEAEAAKAAAAAGGDPQLNAQLNGQT